MAYTVINGRLVKVSKVHGVVRQHQTKFGGSSMPMTPDKPDKGEYAGSCNRRACQKPGATWFNHSTRRYYCANCAWELNNDPFNKRDAQELYGHDLCTDGPDYD